ncbi:MAG: metal-dependent transcriptional regulator [Microbacteriaceae bacterium]
MPVSELTHSAQDYLKTIWQSTEWSEEPVTVKLLAEKLGFRASTISEGIRKLADAELISHQPYGSVELTAKGRHLALMMIRRHRLLETFLVNSLGYTWDEVHDEAEVLEHAVSDLMIDRIDHFLGYPKHDPHGDMIPSASGEISEHDAVQLAELEVGVPGTIVRISDESPDMLRFCTELNVTVNQAVTLVSRHPYVDSFVVRLGEQELPITLSGLLASAIWVTR